MQVDFHTHTTESDGRLTAASLLDAVRKAGIDYFSVTDHDTMTAYERHAELLAPLKRRLVRGMEISTHVDGRDVHILAYNVPLGPSPLREVLGDRRNARQVRADAILEKLHEASIGLTAVDVERQAQGAGVGRAHIARALVAKGYARDTDDAFARFLRPGAAAYVPLTTLTPHRAVRTIRESGAVPVLAHPSRAGAECFVEELAACGLQGIEVFYRTHLPHDVAHYRAVAEQFSLVMTAGSDFHEPTEDVPLPGRQVDAADIEPFLELVL